MFKRILLLVLLVVGLSVSARATSITIQAQTVRNFQYRQTSATNPPHLRIYASASFITSDGVFIPGGNTTNNQFYRDIVCTQSGTTVTIPQFTLDSTTDASSLTKAATYTCYWYTSSGALLSPTAYLQNLYVQPSIVSTSGCMPIGLCATWNDLVLASTPSPPLAPDVYVTQLQMATAITAIAGTVSGIHDPGSNGLLSRTALNTVVPRSITSGSSPNLTVANGDGVAGNPTIGLGANVVTSATAPLGIIAQTISIPLATNSVDGYLSAADHTTFNAKQAALGFTPENAANKNAAGGYAGLSGGKLALAQGQQVWGLTDLTDVTGKKGNSTIVQMQTGATATNDCAKFDANGNIVSAGAGCNSGGMAIGGSVGSGTVGSVPFIATGPVLAQDNANFFWDNTTKRLTVPLFDNGGTEFTVLAIPNGVTDNTSAFTGAVAKAVAAGGGRVVVGFGTFIVSALQIPTGVHLVGSGIGATIIKRKATTSTVLLDMSVGVGNSIRDLTVDGNLANNGASTGLDIALGTDSTLLRVEVKNNVSSVAVQGGLRARVDSCIFTGGGVGAGSTYGLWMALNNGSFDGSQIVNSLFRNWRGPAIFLGGVGVVVDNCVFLDNHQDHIPTGGGQLAAGASGAITVSNTFIGGAGTGTTTTTGTATTGIEVDNASWSLNSLTIRAQSNLGIVLQGGTGHRLINLDISGSGVADFSTGIAASAWVGRNNNPTSANSILPVAEGGTAVGTFALNGVLYGNITTSILATAQGGANTVLVANAGAPSFSASPTIGTSITTPLHIGGAGAGSILTLESTSGVGTTDAILFKTGSQAEALRVLSGGNIIAAQSVAGVKLFQLNNTSNSASAISRILLTNDASLNGYISLYSSTFNSPAALQSALSIGADNGLNLTSGITNANPIKLFSDGGTTPALTIAATTGLVGIGTSSPVQALDVVGNGAFSGSLYAGAPKITAGGGTGITINNVGEIRRETYSVTITYQALAAAQLTADSIIATLPAKTRLVGITADVTQTFSGGAVSAATMTVGKTVGGAEYLASFDVKTATIQRGLTDADLGTALVRSAAVQGGDLPSWTGTTNINVRLTTVTANTNALTQGSVTFTITTEKLF